MSGFMWKGFGVLGAALLVLGSLPAPALAQDDLPDLQLKYVGLNPNNKGEVLYEVHNVGPQWTKDTTVTVELLKGETKVHEQTFEIPDLNPDHLKIDGTLNSYPFAYSLPEGQEVSGHTTKGTLMPARRYDDKLETNLANNVSTVKHLHKISRPPADPVQAVPEHLQVGMHVETFSPIFFASFHEVKRYENCNLIAPRPSPPAAGTTGWLQQETDCDAFGIRAESQTEIAQTGVWFDLAKLDEIKNLRIKSAKLKFDEAKVSWLNGDETPRPVTTCVADVALATKSVGTVSPTALVPNAPRRTPRGATRMTTVWDLELDVRHAALSERGSPTRYQYVIKGDEPGLLGEDDAACMSKLSNVRLEVEYETLP